jgi:hypothetical protein
MFHCHIFEHAERGMAGEVAVTQPQADDHLSGGGEGAGGGAWRAGWVLVLT